MKDNNKDRDKKKAEEEEVNEELKQTFPAGDPPSVTRPGHDREAEEEEKN